MPCILPLTHEWLKSQHSYVEYELILKRNVALSTDQSQFIDRHAYGANLDKCPSFLPTKPDLTPKCLLFQILQPLLLIPETHAESPQSCPTLCNSMDCSPPGSSVCETLHARTLEWVIISFSRGSSQPRD